MPRQKKIVPYVPSTTLPDGKNTWRLVWDDRANHTLDGLLAIIDTRAQNVRDDNSWNNRDYYEKRMSQNGVNESNWRNVDAQDNTKPMYSVITRLCQTTSRLTDKFNEINNAFLAEYDSREDLQEVYKKFYTEVWSVVDRYGNHYHRTYEASGLTRQDIDNRFGDRPETFLMFDAICDMHSARTFIEQNRPTPYQPGDLVRLRDPYVGHPDHDPLFVSRYDQSRGTPPTPDKSTQRLATVIKVTERTYNWRGGKGSKVIRIMWFGSSNHVEVPEKILKWEERPTKKNGLLQS